MWDRKYFDDDESYRKFQEIEQAVRKSSTATNISSNGRILNTEEEEEEEE